ncbi:MAG: molybdenum cofactor biosynthesis protein MoaE [Candidatus Bathyarchaeota archaeon]|nr:molybdenum cofactor biosynthesis protein MoaE [Candidatus Bathyarchaeota archaeon]MDH5791587.1 molybdenum cofactor biosynthesis protein MoaE [Candidatus Bathyarchaeota archaeon]
MIEVTMEDFSVDEVLGRLRTGRMGALVTFVGSVRDISGGKSVDRIEIQVYEEMARKQLEAIREEAMERFGVEEIAIIHRHGSLRVSENIMLIAVGANHRPEAFDACRFVLERIKERVPIWKKEITTDGEFWVEGEHFEPL